jgi:16S rRNA (cytidine1402-2'-O)-methyltransferase
MSAAARRSATRERRRHLAGPVGGGQGEAGSARNQGTELRFDHDATGKTGTLFVVATPIGNLEDITLRALRVLREVALIAAEDTRRSGNLLRHHGIQTPLVSLHEHNEQERVALVLRRLHAGDSVALVSDAGTPGISDPGALLVRSARDAGFRVDPIPGPSAITAVLSASGLSFDRFAFAGFPPVRGNDRKQWFEWVASLSDVPVLAFEAPHRIHRTLADIATKLAERPIMVARELTKAHEEWIVLLKDQILAGGQDPVSLVDAASIPARGEFVLIVGPVATSPTIKVPADEEIAMLFGQLTAVGPGASRRDSLRAVAERLGISARAVFEALERAKNTRQT